MGDIFGVIGEIIGASIIVSVISLLLRKLLLKVTKLTREVALTVAALAAVVFCTLAALPQLRRADVLIYSGAGVLVWIWLFSTCRFIAGSSAATTGSLNAALVKLVIDEQASRAIRQFCSTPEVIRNSLA